MCEQNTQYVISIKLSFSALKVLVVTQKKYHQTCKNVFQQYTKDWGNFLLKYHNLA